MDSEEPPTKKRLLTFKRSFHGTNTNQIIAAQQKEQAAQGFLPRPGKTALKTFRKSRRAAEAERKAEQTLAFAEHDSDSSDVEEAELSEGLGSEDVDAAVSDAQIDSNDSDFDPEDHEPADNTEPIDARKDGNLNVSYGKASNGSPGASLQLSKNQLKKLRKKEAWEAGREDRKLLRKQKTAEKRIRQREAKVEARAAAKSSGKAAASKPPAHRRHVLLPVAFVVDCGFDDLMTEKERMSLGQQVTRCYSDNHKSPFQAHLYVCSWGGKLKERFDTVLEKHYYNWKGVKFTEDDFMVAAEWAGEHVRAKNGGNLLGAFASETSNTSHTQGENAKEPRDEKLKVVSVDDAMPLVGEAATINSTHLENSVMHQADGEEEPALHEAPSAEEQGANDSTGQARPLEETDAATAPQSLPSSPGPEPPQRHDTSPTKKSQESGEVIYLTSDSPHTLDRLKPYSTYIIGGLVDKNRHKGICYKTACDKGIKTAKLPIGEYMEMQSRFVLATNHVVEIMVRWLECGNWGEAFMQVMPKRKGGRLKNSMGDVGDAGDGQEVDVDVQDLDKHQHITGSRGECAK